MRWIAIDQIIRLPVFAIPKTPDPGKELAFLFEVKGGSWMVMLQAL